MTGLTVYQGPDALQIWQPAPFGMVVGMAYIAARRRTFTTYLASDGHVFMLLTFSLDLA
jgi:hypothetical protein